MVDEQDAKACSSHANGDASGEEDRNAATGVEQECGASDFTEVGWEVGRCSFGGRSSAQDEFGELPSVEDAKKALEMKAFKAKHPHLLESIQDWKDKARGKKVAIFLDYDGTLTPIVKDPDKAILSEEMRTVIRDLALCTPTAIISGRSLEKVKGFVQLGELYYAGSHGLDIEAAREGPFATNSTACAYQPAAEYRALMEQILNVLRERVAHIKGSSVEDNKFAVSVHYRNCDPEDWDKVHAVVEQIAAEPEYKNLLVTRGRKVHELKPNVGWNKGKSLLYLLELLGLSTSPDSDTISIYIGDDRTDEDAFAVLRQKGIGHGVIVTTIPRDTTASYSLKDPSEVQTFLEEVYNFVREQ